MGKSERGGRERGERERKEREREVCAEVKDLQQSEFELEKIDGLVTVCWREHNSAFPAAPGAGASTDSLGLSYSNLEMIRRESCWGEETNFWKIPEPIIVKTSLPVVSKGPQNKPAPQISAAESSEPGVQEEDRCKGCSVRETEKICQ